MDYDLCSLIINTIIAFSAVIGIRQSFKSYTQTNKHIEQQMKLQQQPYLNFSITKRSGFEEILVKNIGTGPAISIYKVVAAIEKGTNILHKLDQAPPTYITTLGVNEDFIISKEYPYDYTKVFTEYSSVKNKKEMVTLIAFIYKDLFNNHYLSQFEANVNNGILSYRLESEPKQLTENEISIFKKSLPLYF